MSKLKIVIHAIGAVVLLAGCNRSAEPVAPAAGQADAGHVAEAASADSPAVPPTAPITAAPAAGADSAGEKAVNDSIDASLGDHTQYEPVIRGFQTAVANGEKNEIAAMVLYPFTATIDGKKQEIKDAAAFVADYDKIVTPDIAKVIRDQKYADLFVNYKGVMFGEGQAWINGICTKDSKNCEKFDVKVVTIQPGP